MGLCAGLPPSTHLESQQAALGNPSRFTRLGIRSSLELERGADGRAEREGRLTEKLRFYSRVSLLIVDEIGYLPICSGGANLFLQLVNARYEKGAMILTSNRGFAEWGEVFGDPSSPPRCSIGSCTTRRCPDRRGKLPPSRPRRSHPGAHPGPRGHHTSAASQAPQPAAKERSD